MALILFLLLGTGLFIALDDLEILSRAGLVTADLVTMVIATTIGTAMSITAVFLR